MHDSQQLAHPAGTADLERLAAGLDAQAYAVTLVTSGGSRPRLHVTSRGAKVLTESIYSDGEFFWWGWAERIAPVTDPRAAVAAIGRVLAVLCDSGR
jgi:hypothetical protein